MKMQQIVMLSFLIVLFGIGNAYSNEEGHHEGGHPLAAPGEMKMPETPAGIWHEVREHEEQLNKTIQTGDLAKVHEIAFEIRDFVNALPEKSQTLAGENLENVKSGAERVSEIADLLDKYGDAGDKAKTEEQFARLGKALKFIESQYSPEMLEESGKEHHHN